MVASNVNSFNISGLTPSTDSSGTIIEYDSDGNIIMGEGEKRLWKEERGKEVE